jgi:hypothetical protein
MEMQTQRADTAALEESFERTKRNTSGVGRWLAELKAPTGLSAFATWQPCAFLNRLHSQSAFQRRLVPGSNQGIADVLTVLTVLTVVAAMLSAGQDLRVYLAIMF